MNISPTTHWLSSLLALSFSFVACSSNNGPTEAAGSGGTQTGGTTGNASGGAGHGAAPTTGGGANGGAGHGATGTGGRASGGAADGGDTSAGGATGGAGSGGTASGGSASGGDHGGGSGGALGTGGAVSAEVDKYFMDWPDGTDPLTVGKSAAERFRSQDLPGGSGTDPNDDYKHYRHACSWYGALSVAGLDGDQGLIDDLIAKYEPYKGTWSEFDPPTSANSYKGHVDHNVFGIVPLEIAKFDSDPSYVMEGDLAADHQMANIDSQIRYAIDDMFMITSLQMQAYRVATDEQHKNDHMDVAAETMVDYLTTMQKDDGLFPHHRDDPAFRISWGRGNGWYAAGMAEIIRELPESHPQRDAIVEGYMKMMNGLLQYQIPQGEEGAGLWKQVVDSDDERNWAETSGSAMFTYALVSGVRRGWLDVETFGEPARHAWLGLVSRFDMSSGALSDVSKWAYKPDSHDEYDNYDFSGDEENYYFMRRPEEGEVGNDHGQAPLMWAAAALARPLD